MKVCGIDHINMVVKNLDESIRFYEKMFDFKVKERGEQSNGLPYAIIGEDGAAYMALYETNGSLGENTNGERVAHIGFNIDSFDDIETSLKDLDVKISHQQVDWGKSKSIWIYDPNGFEIELAEKFGGSLG